ncbi:MAG: ATP-dependent DNA ligase [Methanobrevibacter sp.]|uniref:DNA ligase n=1 Tax=Methanobrevibacter millerae TaxID=230361 RepID=A0A8T3VKR9_9EURY|nr:ATP-dependent DNA ligase [Methanobrevibacter sp.]MBE6511187.1 ATP-dependent DNA ligase [Methanobrevibacter millerae]MBO5151930.1 ATP-dependent DNA ligase [Methanobrevibacter sp.]
MKYQELVDVYSALEATTKRLEKTDIIAEYLKKLDADTIGKVGLLLLGGVFPAWSSEEIGIGAKLVERAVAEAVGTTQAKVEDAVRDEGDIGLACIDLYSKKSQMTFFSQPLTINFVFDSLQKLSKISGSRSTNRKISIILELLSQASATEAKYLTRTITEELRIGVGDGIVRDAIAQAFNIDKKIVERAQMLTNDFSVVATTALVEGAEGLTKLNLTPGTPVKPMLAQLSPPVAEIIPEMGTAICETKYDGIRLQVHRNGDEIRIFTRRLENITHALPEIVELFDEHLPHDDYIVEGEVIATRDGKPLPFQNILHRVRRKYNVEEAMENVPLKLYLFDVLYYKEPMIDEPLMTRRQTLESIVDTSVDAMNLSTMIVGTPENIDEIEELFNSSIAAHHEGIMIKDASEPYIPGIRGKKMLKYKAEPETLDMIIVGGTYGIGKRGDFVGSYLVALRDENDEFKTVAYAATGLDDATLEYLTGKMKEIEITTKGREIVVEPKIVLEIAFSEIVESPEYETGYSLRFPVVKNIRKDKGPMDVDTVERLLSMYEAQ